MNKNLPEHVGLIMDGNRRWAVGRGLSKLEGHAKGKERVEPIIDSAIEKGIPYLTFWAFSTENWRRTKEEVDFLMRLFRLVLQEKISSFHKKNVKLRIIGDLEEFSEDIQRDVEEWVEKTRNNGAITVNVALGYGGRDEILRAIQKLQKQFRPRADQPGAEKVKSNKPKVTEEEFGNYLDTGGQPDPDLIIRTGGEQRLSGFMAWQAVYAELYFTDVLWPGFTPDEFEKALKWFQEQKRNFGR